MNRTYVGLTTALFLMGPSLLGQVKADACPMKFSVATKDALGNVDAGLSIDDQKWIDKTLKKHYRGICYEAPTQAVEVLLLISISNKEEEAATATTRTTPNDAGGATSVTSARSRPIDNPVYTLKVARLHDGKQEVLRTFQRENSGAGSGSVSRLLAGFRNPKRDVILDAIDWIASSSVDLSTYPSNKNPKPDR